MLLAAGCAAWQPSIAEAADEDTQLWHYVIVTGKIAKNTRLTLDASHRWREDARGDEQQTFRFIIEQSIAKGVRIGGGVGVFEANRFTETRPTQQITFVQGRFEARTRLEQRWFDSADRMELRLRQRILYTEPLGQGWRASVGAEWFGLLQSREDEEGPSTEQARAMLGIVYRIDQHLEIGVNYWLLVFPRGSLEDRISHVPQTVITYRF
jgi:hypothetical protein